MGSVQSSSTYSSVYSNPPAQESKQFDDLPEVALECILSNFRNPMEFRLICRRICVAAETVRRQQLANACGLSSVNRFCVELLLNFGVNLSSILERPDEEIREEFDWLLEGNFALLQGPLELEKHLCFVLLQNSMREGVRLFGREGCYNDCASLLPPGKTFSKKTVNEILQKLPPIPKPASISCSSFLDETHMKQYLALPPAEVLDSAEAEGLGADLLDLENLSFIPSGLSSIKRFKRLFLLDSSFKSVPPSGLPPVHNLVLWNCPNLTHFPKTLQESTTIDDFSFSGPIESLGLLEEIGRWPLWKLEIQIQNGTIAHLPKSILNMKNLKFLKIEPCVPSVVEDIDRLHLEHLEFDSNDPEAFLRLHDHTGSLMRMSDEFDGHIGGHTWYALTFHHEGS